MAVSYDEFPLAIGFFDGRVCDHDWCQPDAAAAVVYLEGEPGHGYYLCARHFAHLVTQVASDHADAAASRGRLTP